MQYGNCIFLLVRVITIVNIAKSQVILFVVVVFVDSVNDEQTKKERERKVNKINGEKFF